MYVPTKCNNKLKGFMLFDKYTGAEAAATWTSRSIHPNENENENEMGVS